MSATFLQPCLPDLPVRNLVFTALYAAILITDQQVFSTIDGIELVTPLFLGFCYVFGTDGYFLAVVFALLRCLVFGFSPAVILLYLLYYPAFCWNIIFVKRHLKQLKGLRLDLVLSLLAFADTILFTLLDDLITPLIHGFSKAVWLAYFMASLPVAISQSVLAFLSTGILILPLLSVLQRAAGSRKKEKL